MCVERLARGFVVIGVVHAPGDRGVVVAEDRNLRHLAHDVRALVRVGAVADDVAQTVELVDAFLAVGLHHGTERLEIRVNVTENG